jgi:Zn-finger nucleic acid-binding protein
MEAVAVGASTLRECPQCDGLWVDVESFERICADREQQAAVLGAASPAPPHAMSGASGHVRYVPCPVCGQLMNRINFARCSGVIVDVCKGHGTWFDRNELQQIVEFIRAGGIEASRAKERREIEEERRQLRQDQLTTAMGGSSLTGLSDGDEDVSHASVVRAARELLKLF